MTQVGIDPSRGGCWTRWYRRPVSREDLGRYAAAIGSAVLSPRAAPPVFAYHVAQDAVTEALLSVTGDFPRNRMLNGEMAFSLLRPCRPGRTYTSRARPHSLENRRSGALLRVEAEIEDGDGGVLGTVMQTAFLLGLQVPGAETPPGGGDSAPASAGVPRVVRRWVDLDQPARFTAATGEDNPIHRDCEAARAAGLPGIVVQGTCLLAMVADSIAAELSVDAAHARELRARFTAPVTPGQSLETTLYPLGADRYAFSTADEAGTPVLGRGCIDFGGEDG